MRHSIAMRTLSLVAPLSFVLVCLTGCTITLNDTSNQAGAGGQGHAGSAQGGTSAGGSAQGGTSAGGSAQGGAAGQGEAGQAQAGQGQAGSAGTAADPCNGVPAEGRCADATHIERCVVGEGDKNNPGQLSVVQAPCTDGRHCQVGKLGAECVLDKECDEGSAICDGSAARKICTNGAWVSDPCTTGVCQSSPSGAVCADDSGQAGQSYPIKGRLQFEYHPIKADFSGFEEVAADDARGMLAVAYDGDTYLGGTYTSGDDGTFQIDASQKPSDKTQLFFFPMLYDEGSTPQFAVASPSTLTYTNLKSDGYYSYGRATGASTDVGTIKLTEAEGSGAILIHQWILYTILQARQLAPAAKPFNVVALWKENERFDCANGTCYVPHGYGAEVSYGSGKDHYDGVVLIAGTEQSPHHQTPSIILHEFGHYVMDAYSLSPHEAATHYITQPSPPGQAWSEGWATYMGQSTKQDPIYFDRQEGTTWYYDVTKLQEGAKLTPGGSLDQPIAESLVTAILWHLDDTTTNPDDKSWDTTATTTQPIWASFVSPRLTDGTTNRGYKTVDLVDLLDGMNCGGTPFADINAITSHYNYPYDNNPLCK
jgi:hypothetical protein